jgi:uncharacterized integral membrane protein
VLIFMALIQPHRTVTQAAADTAGILLLAVAVVGGLFIVASVIVATSDRRETSKMRRELDALAKRDRKEAA